MLGQENYKYFVLERTQRINYSLPTYLISFPRSGSNFLQFIIEKSSGLRCQSIYGEICNSPNYLLSLKSHAITYEYLLYEINCLLPCVSKPGKIILLHRDPHDVMISYYEYTQTQNKVQIDQGEFLNKDDYFLAALIIRNVRYTLLSVGQAYKQHVRSWFVEPLPDNLDYLIVKYENLVHDPQKEFRRIFDFFELKCSLAEQFLDVKVSLYSPELQQRGLAYGWKNKISRYKTLLKSVDYALQDEIDALGY